MSETRTVETTGPDIEEAIDEGLKLLDVARENVIVEILEEPRRGLMGFGSQLARVRLTTALPPRSEREEFVPSVAEEPEDIPVEKPTVQTDDERDSSSTSHDAAALREAVVSDDETELSEDVRLGTATLHELLNRMNVEADIAVERTLPDDDDDDDRESPWVLHVKGDDLGLLIGHRGKTLAALQYLTRLIAGRDLQSRVNFIIDVENYKARRQVLLKRLAHRLAQDAVRRRRTIEMEPMPPHERRIIHMALKHDEQVSTQSIGDGDHRRVTIIPKR